MSQNSSNSCKKQKSVCVCQGGRGGIWSLGMWLGGFYWFVWVSDDWSQAVEDGRYHSFLSKIVKVHKEIEKGSLKL